MGPDDAPLVRVAWPFPPTLVLCQAHDDGKGGEIDVHLAAKENRFSATASACVRCSPDVRSQCDEHHEVYREHKVQRVVRQLNGLNGFE